MHTNDGDGAAPDGIMLGNAYPKAHTANPTTTNAHQRRGRGGARRHNVRQREPQGPYGQSHYYKPHQRWGRGGARRHNVRQRIPQGPYGQSPTPPPPPPPPHT